MAELIQDIKPKGVASAYVDAPFDEGKKVLENAGYRIITGEENARLRIEHGKEAEVSTRGNYVGEGVLYVPNKGAFITRGSLVMASPKEATDAHRNGQEFHVTPGQVGIVISDSVAVPYGETSVPTNRFGDDEVTRFLFREVAKKYGEFLHEAGIEKMPLRFNSKEYADSKDKPYANQVWLARLAGGSGLYGDSRSLAYGTVRGVFFDAEGVAPSKPLQKVFTLAQISGAFKTAGLPRLESMVVEVLKANN